VDFWGSVKALLLPSFALGVIRASILTRLTRSSMLDVLGEDYVRTARAKGLKERTVIYVHALRNALIPVLTILGLQLGQLMAGAIIIENVFYLPGLGRLVFQAIGQRDLPVVREIVLFMAAAVVLVNFLSVLVVLMAVTSLVWTPYEANSMNAPQRLESPSLSHPLGTDQYGRDILSRVMVGAVNSIIVGLVTVAIGLSLGVSLGLVSAYFGKLVDESIMRFSDLLFGFPAVLTAILITSILGPSVINAMLAIGIFYIPVFARLTRVCLSRAPSSLPWPF
jgi:ABC-type dipeptide/oligopeptide/nickel transport system permease component